MPDHGRSAVFSAQLCRCGARRLVDPRGGEGVNRDRTPRVEARLWGCPRPRVGEYFRYHPGLEPGKTCDDRLRVHRSERSCAKREVGHPEHAAPEPRRHLARRGRSRRRRGSFRGWPTADVLHGRSRSDCRRGGPGRPGPPRATQFSSVDLRCEAASVRFRAGSSVPSVSGFGPTRAAGGPSTLQVTSSQAAPPSRSLPIRHARMVNL